MKSFRICLPFVLLFSITDSVAQSGEVFRPAVGKIHNFKFVIETPIYACNILGQVTEKNVQVAEPGAIFTIVGRKNQDTIIIRFWKWNGDVTLNNKLCFIDSSEHERKYFLIPVSIVKDKCIPRYDKDLCFTAGTVIIPIKLRLKKFDFSKDVTLGPAAGIKFRLSCYKKNFISVLAGLGITSVTLDSRSTSGTIEESMEVPALTPSIGCVFDFMSTTQAGLFLGCDFISNNENLHLIYNGKLWISFGLGFTILTKAGNSSVEDE